MIVTLYTIRCISVSNGVVNSQNFIKILKNRVFNKEVVLGILIVHVVTY